jgi:hypothetical protein
MTNFAKDWILPDIFSNTDVGLLPLHNQQLNQDAESKDQTNTQLVQFLKQTVSLLY